MSIVKEIVLGVAIVIVGYVIKAVRNAEMERWKRQQQTILPQHASKTKRFICGKRHL
jgi:hypothetical protein